MSSYCRSACTASGEHFWANGVFIHAKMIHDGGNVFFGVRLLSSFHHGELLGAVALENDASMSDPLRGLLAVHPVSVCA